MSSLQCIQFCIIVPIFARPLARQAKSHRTVASYSEKKFNCVDKKERHKHNFTLILNFEEKITIDKPKLY